MTSITLGAYLGERPCPAHETSGAISRRGAGAMFSQGFFRFGRGYVSSYGKRVSSKCAEKALSMTGGTILFWGSVAGVGHYYLSSSFRDGLNASCDGNTVKSMPSGSSTGLKIFTGNANKPLANEIAKHLGINLGKMKVGKFADGEVNVVVGENVRGKDVYIVQPTGPPVNENLMELLLMISTMRRASARKITAVIPYYGYARQDRKMTARVPISAADIARLLEAMGVDRVIAVDLHCGQIQGFFGPRVPVDNLDGGMVGVSYFGDMDLDNPVIVSPDAGGVYRAKQFREALAKKHDVDCGLAMIVKQRAKANEIERMDLVGSVKDGDAIIVDDMVDTAGTLCKAADELKKFGARRVFAFASHGVFSGPAPKRIHASALTELVVLDTLKLNEPSAATGKISQLSVGPLLAQAIYNIHNKKSISALFK